VNKLDHVLRQDDLSQSAQDPARRLHPHPDSDRPTRRISFEELRSLILALIEPEDDAVREFEAEPTTHLRHRRTTPTPPRPHARQSTLDALIEELIATDRR